MLDSKTVKYLSGSRIKPKVRTSLKKERFQFQSPMDEANPHMRIYYPSPPPQSPTGYPPPPLPFVKPIAPPQMEYTDKSGEQNQPHSTEETFNRPTTQFIIPNLA